MRTWERGDLTMAELAQVRPQCLCLYAIAQGRGEPVVHDKRCPESPDFSIGARVQPKTGDWVS